MPSASRRRKAQRGLIAKRLELFCALAAADGRIAPPAHGPARKVDHAGFVHLPHRSEYRLAQHNVLTNRICSIVRHGASSSRGLAKITANARARLIATLSRLRL